jgi:hypothetical protein
MSPTSYLAAPERRLCSLRRGSSLTIRELVFGHDALDLVAPDAISEASVCLDGQAPNDGVDFRFFDLRPSLRALAAMKDCIVQPVAMGHLGASSGSFDSLIEHDLLGKPLHTFPDHAL